MARFRRKKRKSYKKKKIIAKKAFRMLRSIGFRM